MHNPALDTFISELNAVWGPLSSRLTQQSKQILESLIVSCQDDDWFNELVSSKANTQQIYADKQNGYVLMGHVEQSGDKSPPHDHGDGWVIYSTVVGEVKMGLFNRVETDDEIKAVQKDSFDLQPGQSSVYLPGDIHDTETVQNNTVMLRLTSCDFNQEVESGRLTRYPMDTEKWA